jgi:methionyl-tRNA formyltransferase
MEYQDILLRRATIDDVDFLFQLANDLDGRNNTFNPLKITLEGYKASFKNIHKSNGSVQYILMNNSIAVGQICFILSNETAEIEFHIASEFRCLNYERIIIALLIEKILDKYPVIQRLVAKIKPNNISSRKALIDNGFIGKEIDYSLDLKKSALHRNQILDEGKMKKVLFLTNNWNTMQLFDWISNQNVQVDLCSDKINAQKVKAVNPVLIVSYNYSHIIKKDVLEVMQGRIVNLHTSLLPWNRGASPNVWSFFDDTPKGVTIHQVDEGLDTGPIIYQKECSFVEENETFESSYIKVHEEISNLFKKHWLDLLNGTYRLQKQKGIGSYHNMKELNKLRSVLPFEYFDNIAYTKRRYEDLKSQLI